MKTLKEKVVAEFFSNKSYKGYILTKDHKRLMKEQAKEIFKDIENLHENGEFWTYFEKLKNKWLK